MADSPSEPEVHALARIADATERIAVALENGGIAKSYTRHIMQQAARGPSSLAGGHLATGERESDG